MKKIVCIYASKDNQTQKISHYLAKKINDLSANSLSIEIINVSSVNQLSIPIHEYDLIIFGAPVRYGKHLPEITTLIKQHIKQYSNQKTAFFSVNLTARKKEKSTPETSIYTQKLFKSVNWTPYCAAVFAGKLNYPKYRLFDKLIIRFIMWLTKGPTSLDTVIEYTNWGEVDTFAQLIIQKLSVSNEFDNKSDI